MSLQNYLEKQRARPVRERERLAVIWTAVAFAVIFIIWIVSFKEMNKPVEAPADETSASLDDLKSNFQTGKDSIQDMMQELPASSGSTNPTPGSDNPNTQNNLSNDQNAGGNSQNPSDNSDTTSGFPKPPDGFNPANMPPRPADSGQDKPSVPQLP